VVWVGIGIEGCRRYRSERDVRYHSERDVRYCSGRDVCYSSPHVINIIVASNIIQMWHVACF
jgi:hypothetical protein